MASTTTLVVMGVSGSGKSTVARAVAQRLGWESLEGDELHPQANVERMRSGRALRDEDRWPWLALLAEWVGAREQAGQNAVLTCSALRRTYRDRLRAGHPSVCVAHVAVSGASLRERLAARPDHWMPPSLLDSQLAALEPLQDDEPGLTVDGERSVDAVVDLVTTWLTAAGRT